MDPGSGDPTASTTLTQQYAILPPLLQITDDDRRGIIACFAAFSLSVLLSSLVLRAYARWRNIKSDDWVVLTASCISTIRTSVVLFAVSIGLGLDFSVLTDAERKKLELVVWSIDGLFILGDVVSKLSVLSLVKRLTSIRRFNAPIWCLVISILLWGLVSILTISIDCFPSQQYEGLDQCPGLLARFSVIIAWDMMLELVLITASILLVLRHVTTRKTKALIILIFSSRFPVIVASALRLAFTAEAIVGDANPAYILLEMLICNQIELDYGIIASTLTCLGTIISPFTNDIVFTSGVTSNVTSPTTRLNTEKNIMSVRQTLTLHEMPDLIKLESPMGRSSPPSSCAESFKKRNDAEIC